MLLLLFVTQIPKKVMSLKDLPSRTIIDIQNKVRAARDTVNIKNFGKQVKGNVIHGYKVVRNAVNTVRNYGLVSKVTFSNSFIGSFRGCFFVR